MENNEINQVNLIIIEYSSRLDAIQMVGVGDLTGNTDVCNCNTYYQITISLLSSIIAYVFLRRPDMPFECRLLISPQGCIYMYRTTRWI
jgi:hypothetical protein